MFETLFQTINTIPSAVQSMAAAAVAAICLVSFVRRLRSAACEPNGENLELRRLRHYVGALRAFLVGLCSAVFSTGLILDIEALVGLALIIGLEELYETTMLMGLIRFGMHMETRTAAG
jgi:hypothetical protein